MERIVLLNPLGVFSKRDYDRFGIKILKKNFIVNIFDLTAWLYPNFWKENFDRIYKCEEYKSISCKEDFLILNNKKQYQTIILDCLTINNNKTNWLKNKFKKNKKNLFVELQINQIPEEKKSFIQRLKEKKLASVPIILLSFFFKTLNNIYIKINNKFNPDILILGGLISKRRSNVKHTIFAHCMDYDIYLENLNRKGKNENNYVVFLDEDMTSHQDYFFFNLDSPISEIDYYSNLAKFIKKFQKENNIEVKFATHPKSKKNNYEDLLEGIKCYKHDTANLVKNSKAVLLHASTSVSFAVLYKKPTIFLISNKLKQSWIGSRIENFASILNSQIINIDNPLTKLNDFEKALKVDEKKYQNYLDLYIKYPNSADVPLWEIFTKYIKDKKLSINKY
jgi:hypothetical protein